MYAAIAIQKKVINTDGKRLTDYLKALYLAENPDSPICLSYEETNGSLHKYPWQTKSWKPVLFENPEDARKRAEEWTKTASANSLNSNWVASFAKYDSEQESLEF